MKKVLIIVSMCLLGACRYSPGPDKQGGGMIQGAATGAITGATTAVQFTSPTGPGAAVGAGIGAVAGALQGAAADAMEEEQERLGLLIKEEKNLSHAHALLAEHYQRRLELHPTRDIYPADYFFFGDETKLRQEARALVDEIARLNINRLPWSRLVITSYVRVKSKDKKEATEYAYYLGEKRVKALANQLIHSGVEPRRIESRSMVIEAPILLDPHDDPLRYNQAVEITPVDR